MENFEAFRENLVKEIKQEPNHDKRREILAQAQETEEYSKAEQWRENERRLEKVKELICDVREYEGFVHATKVQNIESIFTNGLGFDKNKIASGGRIPLAQGYYEGEKKPIYEAVYLGYSTPNSETIERLENLALEDKRRAGWTERTKEVAEKFKQKDHFLGWQTFGSLTLLFDTKKLAEMCPNLLIDSAPGDPFSEPDFDHPGNYKSPRYPFSFSAAESIKKTDAYFSFGAMAVEGGAGFPEFRYFGYIPKETITAIVIENKPSSERVHKKVGEDEYGNKKYKVALELRGEKIGKAIIHRMNRLARNPKAHLAPVFRINGDMIWPEKISHQEIIQTIKSRTTYKDSGKTDNSG